MADVRVSNMIYVIITTPKVFLRLFLLTVVSYRDALRGEVPSVLRDGKFLTIALIVQSYQIHILGILVRLDYYR